MDRAPDIDALGGASLAYIGDAVVELWVRRMFISLGIVNPSVCSAEALQFVPARAQSAAYTRISELLTEFERNIFMRGRNAHVTAPKSASTAEYHRATGLEALMGALYLSGDEKRIDELLIIAYADKIESLKINHNISK